MGEPALAFSREGQQHVLEPAKSSLAVDGNQQSLAQGLILYHADETFHPAVLLA